MSEPQTAVEALEQLAAANKELKELRLQVGVLQSEKEELHKTLVDERRAHEAGIRMVERRLTYGVRDKFAVAVLNNPVLFLGIATEKSIPEDLTPLAKRAYRVADAMLKERG